MHAWYTPKTTYNVQGEKMKIGCDVRNSIDGTSSFGCGVFTYRKICKNGVIYGHKQIAGFSRIHTKGLQPIIKNLKERMLLVMEKAEDILRSYKELAEQTITNELIEKIRKSRIPKKVLPGYISEKKADQPQITQWQLYNDLTELIWHNPKSDLRTKNFQFQTLHAVLKV